MSKIIWRAYCITCQKELEACSNGGFAEGAARVHMRGTDIYGCGLRNTIPGGNESHKVLIGYLAELPAATQEGD